jgi:hypothetical protein
MPRARTLAAVPLTGENAAFTRAGFLAAQHRPKALLADLQQFRRDECNNRNISLPAVSSLL